MFQRLNQIFKVKTMSEDHLADVLARMKDLSEMAIDLAYSALLYGSEEIADHVLDMEQNMNKLHIEFELGVLEKKEYTSAKVMLGSVRISMAAEQLVDAAGLIANIVKRGARAPPILEKALEGAGETIVSTTISESSSMAQKKLGELGLDDDIGMRVIAVKRGPRWNYIPSDDFVLEADDVIIARGYIEGRQRLLDLANPEEDEE